MAFGLQKQEIESIVGQTIETVAKRSVSGAFIEGAQLPQVALAIAEAITQNNARILEALAEAGVKIEVK